MTGFSCRLALAAMAILAALPARAQTDQGYPARPIRMIASDGEGRLRKRAIAPKKTRMAAVMAATRPPAICQTSIPLNSDLNMT